MKQDIALNKQRGFSLIELMIVVAIIGVLAAVAVPLYHNYMVKTKIATVLGSMAPIKTAIAVCVLDAGGITTACNAGENGIPVFSPTKEILSATTTQATITVVLANGIGSDIDGQSITMTPAISEGWVNWDNTTTITNPSGLAAIMSNNVP